MKIQMFSVKDNVGGFLQPTFALYEPQALRDFSYAVNNAGLMNFKPEDYSLWHVGEFDTELGTVEYIEPKLIVHATEVIK